MIAPLRLHLPIDKKRCPFIVTFTLSLLLRLLFTLIETMSVLPPNGSSFIHESVDRIALVLDTFLIIKWDKKQKKEVTHGSTSQ